MYRFELQTEHCIEISVGLPPSVRWAMRRTGIINDRAIVIRRTRFRLNDCVASGGQIEVSEVQLCVMTKIMRERCYTERTNTAVCINVVGPIYCIIQLTGSVIYCLYLIKFITAN